MAITYRTSQYGGANTPLTNAQIDANFNYLETRPSGATLADDTSTNTNYYIGLSSSTTGSWINAYTSSTKLYYNPSTGTLSSTNFNSLSDERFKTDIVKIDSSLNKVNSISGYTFKMLESGQQSAGLIAQQVQLVLPEAVGGDENKLTLNYGAVMGLLVEAIKELNAKVDQIQKQLEDK